MAGTSDVWRLQHSTIQVGVGATVAQFVTPIAGQVGIWLKLFSGGSAEIFGASYTGGQSGYMAMSAADLASSSGNGYPLYPDVSAPQLHFIGAPYFSIAANGATGIVKVVREISNSL